MTRFERATNSPNTAVSIQERSRQPDEIDLAIYLSTILDHKWEVLRYLLAALFLALALIVLAPAGYEANALLQVDQNEQSRDEVIDLNGVLVQDNLSALAELDLIRSRDVLEKVIDQLRLDIDVQASYFPMFGSMLARSHEDIYDTLAEPPLSILDAYSWGGEELEIAELQVPPDFTDETLKLVSTQSGQYEFYDFEDNLLFKGTVGTPGIVTLPDRSASKGTIKLLVSKLRARPGITFKVVKTHRLSALEDLLDRLEVIETAEESGIINVSLSGDDPKQIAQIVNSIVSVYLEKDKERTSKKIQKMMDFVGSQLPMLSDNLGNAEMVLSEFQVKYGAVDLDLAAKTNLDTLADVEKQISSLELLRVEYEPKYTPEHPVRAALQEQLEELNRSREIVKNKLNDLPEAQLNAIRAARNISVFESLYSLLRTTGQELGIAQAGITGSVQLVDAANVPIDPTFPDVPLILAAAIVVGLFGGIFIVLFKQAIQTRIERPRMLEEHFGIPVIGVIPRFQKQDLEAIERITGSPAFAEPHARELSAARASVEGMRNLRTTLMNLVARQAGTVVNLAGALEDQENRQLCKNLCSLIAAAGHPVVLIDADLRSGIMHKDFAVDGTPGLSDYLALCGESDTDEAQKPVANVVGKLDFIACGTPTHLSSELLTGDRFKLLMDEMVKSYSAVIVHSPPALACTDSSVIAASAGVNLITIRYGVTTLSDVQLIQEQYRNAGVTLDGAIMVGTNPPKEPIRMPWQRKPLG